MDRENGTTPLHWSRLRDLQVSTPRVALVLTLALFACTKTTDEASHRDAAEGDVASDDANAELVDVDDDVEHEASDALSLGGSFVNPRAPNGFCTQFPYNIGDGDIGAIANYGFGCNRIVVNPDDVNYDARATQIAQQMGARGQVPFFILMNNPASPPRDPPS